MFHRTRSRRERDMAEEMAAHLRQRAEDLAAQGLAPGEAARQAAVEFGSLPRYREESRAAWGAAGWDAIAGDLRYALRQIRRGPGFAIAVVVTLALAVGANTAIFATLYAVLLRPLPYPHPDQLVEMNTSISLPEFRTLQAKTRGVFQTMAVEGWSEEFTLEDQGAPRDIPTVDVTPGFFRVLGTPPLLGRVFTRADLNGGHRHVIVLGYSLWRSVFGGNPKIVGRQINLSGALYRVTGVMPASFLSEAGNTDQIWAPLPMKAQLRGADFEWLLPLGRLRPGVSLAQAQAAMRTAQKSISRRNDLAMPIMLYTYASQVVAGFSQPLWLLFTAAGLILLIACLNLAGLCLARNTGRRAEIATRAALGASRWRIVRQLLVESGLLAVLGCALGVLTGAWMLAALRTAAAAAGMPRVQHAGIGWAALTATAAAFALALILFGLLPAWESEREDMHAAARRAIAPRRHRRLREALVVGELALAVALAFGAGLLLRSYAGLTSLPLGFNPHHLLTFTTRVPPSPAQETPARQTARSAALARAALPRLKSLPGVRVAAATRTAPFQGLWLGFFMSSDSHSRSPAVEGDVGPGYFNALGARLLAGRGFALSDGPHSRPVAIVSQALAQALWPGKNPLDRQLLQPGSKTPFTVIGEAANIMQYGPVGPSAGGLNMLAQPAVYFPLAASVGPPQISFLLRTRTPPASLEPSVRKLFQRLNPTEPVTQMQTMDQIFSSLLAAHRLYLELLLALAALAIALVAAGIYSITRFMAAARTGEMGIRKALGAEDGAILRLMLSRAVLLAAIGTAIGCGLALLLARLLTSLLYGVQPADPTTLGATAVFAFAVALAAAYGPARRAAHIEPMSALRCE